jgi:hypothetical protein
VIFIPPLTLEANKTTVLNCFLFRQTDLIPGGALGKGTAPLDLNQQCCPGKMKAQFRFRLHDDGYPKDWPLPKKISLGRESNQSAKRTVEGYRTASGSDRDKDST